MTKHKKPVLDVDAVMPADPFPLAGDRPCWRCYDDPINRDGKVWPAGVYLHSVKNGKSGTDNLNLIDNWVCAPLHVEAKTANQDDSDHGRLLHYRNTRDNWKKWAMPMSLLAGDGQEPLKVLMSEGLELERNKKGRVLDYINNAKPEKFLYAAATTGWYGDAFVLPDEVIGGNDDIWYQATERTAPYSKKGTLQEWQDLVAKKAIGNPLLTLGISVAFAGSLLNKAGIDGAGIHLFGDSSKGKTTILMAAISVWGSPRFKRTWRTTANGIEGAARLHTGTILPLDEVGEVSPKDLYESAYSLINGQGKTRANVRGEARLSTHWCVFVLSTGEETISDRLISGGFDVKAGQGVRLLDIPATARKYGSWDDIHDFDSSGAFSDNLRNSAAANYGLAGAEFIRAIINSKITDSEFREKLDQIKKHLDAVDSQENRVASVFALCALAGEIAASAGIVPWPEGLAIKAAKTGFDLWREQRGTNGKPAEDVDILLRINDFIERHGESRFSSIKASLDTNTRPTINRAGYVDWNGTRPIYLFTSSGLGEAIKPHGKRRAIAALEKAGAFTKIGENATAVTTRAPDGTTPRLYYIDPSKLQI